MIRFPIGPPGPQGPPGPAASYSLTAFAFGVDGSTWTTPEIVSQQSYALRDVFQTPSASTISVRLGTIPITTPTVLSVRIDGGKSLVTNLIHPADGDDWALTATADPYTFILQTSVWENSVFIAGHAYVSGTLIDASVQLNILSAWMRVHAPATCYLPLGGLYVLEEEVRFPESSSIYGQGGARTFFFLADSQDMTPPGDVHHVLGSGAGDSLLYCNITDSLWQGFTVYGNRGHAYSDSSHPIGRGDHAIDLGSDSNVDFIMKKYRVLDVHVYGGAGYVESGGGGNSKQEWIFRDCTWGFSDSDAFDLKNKISTNTTLRWNACNFYWHAQGSQGTNVEPMRTTTLIPITVQNGSRIFSVPIATDPTLQIGDVVNIVAATFHKLIITGARPVVSIGAGVITFQGGMVAADASDTTSGSGVTWISSTQKVITTTSIPVTTTSGQTTFTVPLITTDPNTRSGEIANLAGPTFNGISLNGPFRVVATDNGSNTITLDAVTQTANASSTSAGTGMTYLCPHISVGDVVIDGRGLMIWYTDCYWEGEMYSRNVFRQRGGDVGGSAGLGGTYLSATNCKGKDRTAAWVAATDGAGRGFIATLGVGAVVTGCTFECENPGTSICYNIGSAASSTTISGGTVERASIGATVAGENIKISGVVFRNSTLAAVSIYGATQSDDQDLPDDPFTALTTGGSSPTTCNVSAPSHGRGIAGATFSVQFAGFHNAFGLALVGSNQPMSTYTGTVVDANNYTVPIAGSATSTAPWGGQTCRAIYGTISHIADDVSVIGNTFFQTVGNGNTAYGIANGYDPIAVANGRATNSTIVANHDDGSFHPYKEGGTSTTWQANSGGIPANIQRVLTLLADGSGISPDGRLTLTAGDSGSMIVSASGASAQTPLTLPDNTTADGAPSGFWVDVECNNTTGANGVKFLTTAGTIADGNNSSSNPGSIASSTTGASGRMVWRAAPGYRFINKSGTWTLA